MLPVPPGRHALDLGLEARAGSLQFPWSQKTETTAYVAGATGPLMLQLKLCGVAAIVVSSPFDFGNDAPPVPFIRKDLRDVTASDLRGFDALIHLAALSNDPLGDLNPTCTYDINQHASVRLARLGKEAGIARFLFSSSCSLYGMAGDEFLTEEAPFNPITPYGETKVLVERAVSVLSSGGLLASGIGSKAEPARLLAT